MSNAAAPHGSTPEHVVALPLPAPPAAAPGLEEAPAAAEEAAYGSAPLGAASQATIPSIPVVPSIPSPMPGMSFHDSAIHGLPPPPMLCCPSSAARCAALNVLPVAGDAAPAPAAAPGDAVAVAVA